MFGKRLLYGVLILVIYEIIKDQIAEAISEKTSDKIIHKFKVWFKELPDKQPEKPEIIFSNKTLSSIEEADFVLKTMKEIMAVHGEVTVWDYYEFIGKKPKHADRLYGWTEFGPGVIVTASIVEGYFIALPNPQFLK